MISMWACAGLAVNAEPPIDLRYSSQEGRVVGYRIEIVADRHDALETLKGVACYDYRSTEGESLRITYKGGLTRTSKSKPSSESSRFGPPHFGPSFFDRSRSFSPFAGMRFRGLMTTTNELCLDSQGEIQSLEGDSQLPYLLGNACLLVFEPLPDEPKQSWSVNSAISITEEGDRPGFPYRPIPFRTREPERTTVGSEILTYQVRDIEGPIVVIDKTYRLESPAATKSVSGFEINGTGTWRFNRELGLSESMDFKQKLIVQKGNTTISFPMTIAYGRMSEEELRVHEEEQKKRQEEAQKRLAEMQEKQARTPFTEQEIEELLVDLRSDNVSVVLTALQKLQRKKPKKVDVRIAKAVDELGEHSNPLVQHYLEKIIPDWPLPEGVLSGATRKRTWSDNTGTFSVEAEFLALDGDTVHLRRSDGKELEVPMRRLSEPDQEAARKLAEAVTSASDNPFE